MNTTGKVWRITGPPENFITAITRGYWAVNEHNRKLWENKLTPGDTILFHSTKKCSYSSKVKSAIIGYGVVGNQLFEKNELWWIQETEDNQNYWPYVFDLKNVYLFSELEEIDFTTSIQEKNQYLIKKEVEALSASGTPLKRLNTRAKKISTSCPAFPVNGSISGVNQVFEELLFSTDHEVFFDYSKSPDGELETKWGEVCDDELASKSKEEVLASAQRFKDDHDNQYTMSNKPRKVRKEDASQKRRIASLEDYTCQVCGFSYSYTNAKGHKRWIIEVDHIIEKSRGGGETIGNLWVLCPNCHAKKTRGIIEINPRTKTVKENGNLISIKDNHLGW